MGFADEVVGLRFWERAHESLRPDLGPDSETGAPVQQESVGLGQRRVAANDTGCHEHRGGVRGDWPRRGVTHSLGCELGPDAKVKAIAFNNDEEVVVGGKEGALNRLWAAGIAA